MRNGFFSLFFKFTVFIVIRIFPLELVGSQRFMGFYSSKDTLAATHQASNKHVDKLF